MISILIPPIPHLFDFALKQPMDLLLAHLLISKESSSEYWKFYNHKRETRPDSYFILDNGAHELEQGLTTGDLLDAAEMVRANEIVLPDKLFDAEQTYLGLVDALEHLWHDERVVNYRYMIVPQGRDHREYVDCLEACVAYFEAWRKKVREVSRTLEDAIQPPVIGVSKDYHEMFSGGISELLRDYIVPVAQSIETDIHLLGWVKTLWDQAAIRREFGHVIRSTDSARPFTFAMNDISLGTQFLSGEVPKYPGRPEDFFHRRMSSDELRTADTNITVYRSLCTGS